MGLGIPKSCRKRSTMKLDILRYNNRSNRSDTISIFGSDPKKNN